MVRRLCVIIIIFFFFFFFFYRQHIHHITCTEQDKHITSVNDSYCYLCAQHITFFLKAIVIVINLAIKFTMIRMIKLLQIVCIICFCQWYRTAIAMLNYSNFSHLSSWSFNLSLKIEFDLSIFSLLFNFALSISIVGKLFDHLQQWI